jgi:hypothetical protein
MHDMGCEALGDMGLGIGPRRAERRGPIECRRGWVISTSRVKTATAMTATAVTTTAVTTAREGVGRAGQPQGREHAENVS